MASPQNPYTPPRQSVLEESVHRRTSHGDNPLQGDYGPFRDNSLLAKFLTALLLLEIGIAWVDVFLNYIDFAQVPFEQLTDSQLDLLHYTLVGTIGFGILALFAMVATGILFCVWVNRSSKNAWLFARLRSATPLKTTPGWAIGWFFVPVAFLWKPYAALREIREHSLPSDAPQHPPILGLWWTFWLIELFQSFVVPTIPGQNLAGTVISAGFSSALAIFAILVVRQITSGQTEMHQKLNQWFSQPFQRN